MMNNKPRLNHPSLIQMAIRLKKAILSSGYKSQTMQDMITLLDWQHERLDTSLCPPEELAIMEQQLEVMELFLFQLWISTPYNGILLMPRKLNEEQQQMIFDLIQEAKKEKRHLRIAYSQAA